MTKVSFSIPINNDRILEDDEEFNLIIITDSLPNGIVTGDTSKATVIIRNDDSELVFQVFHLIATYVAIM